MFQRAIRCDMTVLLCLFVCSLEFFRRRFEHTAQLFFRLRFHFLWFCLDFDFDSFVVVVFHSFIKRRQKMKVICLMAT